ncbi:MAG: hypothetical protein ABW185_11825 [Sedimenticola sp.]
MNVQDTEILGLYIPKRPADQQKWLVIAGKSTISAGTSDFGGPASGWTSESLAKARASVGYAIASNRVMRSSCMSPG